MTNRDDRVPGPYDTPLIGTTQFQHVGANWDMWATFAELAGGAPPAGTDGLSILPTLLGRGKQRAHDALYWEFMPRVGRRRWKGIRREVSRQPDAPVELYDLQADENETKDVAVENPELAGRTAALMRTSRPPAVLPKWNFGPIKK